MKTLRGILLFEMLPVLVVTAGAAAAYHLYSQQAAVRAAEDRLASAAELAAELIHRWDGSGAKAVQLATRCLDEVEVLLELPTGQTHRLYGQLPPADPVLAARGSIGGGATVVVRQSRLAGLAGFRQGQRGLLVPLAAVTLGMLLITVLGTQRVTGELRRIQRQSEEANAAKGEFLAHMSHEIRTPMNGILGMLELLQTARLKPQEREYLDMAREAADSLLRLLNDILDFSKIEAGHLELDEAPFDVRQLIQGTLQTLAVRAAEKGLCLSVDVGPDVPGGLLGDAGRIRQILVNLVGNAIKFTPRGRVEVRVGAAVDSPGCGARGSSAPPLAPGPGEFCLHIAVRDTGIGIPADKRQLIFEAFRQADRSTSRRFGGTGLGLAIASELVNRMHGRLWLDARQEQGSTFHFALCLAIARLPATGGVPAAPGRAVPEDLPPPPRSARILLAEDGRISQKVAVRLLERRGHQVVVVEDGEQAVEALEHDSFDVVLMDIEMPGMDGLQATRAIRSRQNRTGSRIPIIAMTAHAIKGDRERFLAAGMDDYLAKPVCSRTLYEVVERHVPAAAADNRPALASRT